MIGLGASGPQVIEGFHGVPYDKPLARTREIIEIIRRGLRREPLTNDGIYTAAAARGPGPRARQAAQAPQQARAQGRPALGRRARAEVGRGAAEVADGWLPFLFHPEKAQLVWGDALAKGTAKRPEGLAPLEISAGGMVAIGEDVKGMLDFMRPMYALYVGGMGARGKNFYNELACQYGYEKEAKEIQDLYLDGNKRDAEAQVPIEWLEAGNLVGPASYVKERIAAFQEAGVTSLQVSPASDDPAATIAQVKEWVS